MRPTLLADNPQGIHFFGHGTTDAGLILEDELRNVHPLATTVLARLLKLCASLECGVFKGCYSEVQTRAIASHIPYVIGRNQTHRKHQRLLAASVGAVRPW